MPKTLGGVEGMMKLILAALLAAFPAFCIGTVTQTLTKLSVPASEAGNANGDVFLLTVSWVGDASSGAVPTTTLIRSSQVMEDTNGLYLYQMITDPGSPAPTTLYDITLVASTGLDMLGAAGADRSATVTESAVPSSLNPIFDGNVSFTLANQSVASAQGTVKLLLLRNGALRAGLGGITFPLSVLNGGTGAASFTGSRCIESNAGGTALVVAGAACAAAGVSLTGTNTQFAYQSGANALTTTAAFLYSPALAGYADTPVSQVWKTAHNCALYDSQLNVGGSLNRDYFNFDCSVSSRYGWLRFIANGGNSLGLEMTSGGSFNLLANAGDFAIITDKLALGATTALSLSAVNTTAAAVGAQQVSPAIAWTGAGWKTNATAASQAVGFQSYALPVQGAVAPSVLWKLQSNIAGSVADKFMVNSLGSAGPLPINADPGCAAATIGQHWIDNTSAVATLAKVCLNVASTPTWVTYAP